MTDRLLRTLAALVVLVLLVAGLAVGLVALARSWTSAGPDVRQPVCTAEVADPDREGARLRAALAPDQTANAALVVGLANQRGLPARAATIGVATAIQESGLRNIDYGDRDSLGLFQQRPSQGWGTEEQVQDPLYSTGAFYDALVRVDGYAGLEITDAAQRVQRSGFPEAYADHEGEGRALASSLYGLSPASLSCDLLAVQRPDGEAAPPVEATAEAMLAELGAWAPGGWAHAVEAVETADADGAVRAVLVLDAAAAAEPGRLAWALAHTGVALAERHDLVRVEVDGMVWDRAERGTGWVAAEEGAGTAAGDGRVRISLG